MYWYDKGHLYMENRAILYSTFKSINRGCIAYYSNSQSNLFILNTGTVVILME